MNEVSEYLRKSGVQYFATVGTDGKPKVRPFSFMLEEGGKLFFCTSNRKPVFSEMSSQPNVEVCCMGENSSWLRLRGKAVFVKDLGLKEKIQNASPTVKGIYKTPDNPVFEAFYISDAEAVISDFSGNPPRTIRL